MDPVVAARARIGAGLERGAAAVADNTGALGGNPDAVDTALRVMGGGRGIDMLVAVAVL